MDAKLQEVKATEFVDRWKDCGLEKQESQRFWIDLLHSVFGVENPAQALSFEKPVKVHSSVSDKDNFRYIDVYIPDTKVMIEQKGRDIDLLAKAKQSDGAMLTPYEQAKRYADALKNSERPRFIVTSNFNEFYVYDLDEDNPEENKYHILLSDLPKEFSRLSFLTNLNEVHLQKQFDLSVEAGNLVGKLYDTLLSKFVPTDDPEQVKKNLHSLNVLCVRIVFCLYAEDAGLFNKDSFADYLKSFKVENARAALINFFKWIDTKDEDRDPYADDKLKAFPYVNGGLFHDKEDEKIVVPPFDESVVDLITNELSLNFNWSNISPTIFGAVFESTLNPETRRSGGMHYTSLENIHKVIDPLFLDDLKQELQKIKEIKQEKKLQQACDEYQQKLAKLVFLDPAAGSGNFLTETYLCLRRLENEVFLIKGKGQSSLGAVFSPILVSLDQFYGIEINDFAVSVAKTAMWIAEAQMQAETEKILNQQLNFFPLKNISHYVEGNALRLNWEDIVPKEKLSFIIGNPPFVGASMMSKEQKNEAVEIFGKVKLSNSIDYVGAWFCKASKLVQKSNIRCAFVATNSITQGEQVYPLWNKLFNEYGIQIIFGYRTFRWDSDASLKAHVHCVIIGFCSNATPVSKKEIIKGSERISASNINGYLLDAPNIEIISRSTPICRVPKMTKGNQPTDGGNLILSQQERDEILRSYPELDKFIHKYIGSEELIKNKVRYCFWLANASPAELRHKEIARRLSLVKELRLKSTAKPTIQKAETPHLFFSQTQPSSDYIMVPRVSSERRKYVPMAILPSSVIASDAGSITETASLYDLGVLISEIHMAWMRTVCGRLKSDYRYSGSIVYNNFPWPTPTEDQKSKIEKTAQGILDARALYPDSSLADLYDELTMPIELRKAHQANDKAVMEAYGFDKNLSEEEIVAKLFDMYASLVENAK